MASPWGWRSRTVSTAASTRASKASPPSPPGTRSQLRSTVHLAHAAGSRSTRSSLCNPSHSPRGGRPGRDGKVRWLRARDFDLDIYTNFLSKTRKRVQGELRRGPFAISGHAGRDQPQVTAGGRSGRAVDRYVNGEGWLGKVGFAVLPLRASVPRPERRDGGRRCRCQRPHLERRRVRVRPKG